jgi:hypothetical protein
MKAKRMKVELADQFIRDWMKIEEIKINGCLVAACGKGMFHAALVALLETYDDRKARQDGKTSGVCHGGTG